MGIAQTGSLNTYQYDCAPRSPTCAPRADNGALGTAKESPAEPDQGGLGTAKEFTEPDHGGLGIAKEFAAAKEFFGLAYNPDMPTISSRGTSTRRPSSGLLTSPRAGWESARSSRLAGVAARSAALEPLVEPDAAPWLSSVRRCSEVFCTAPDAVMARGVLRCRPLRPAAVSSLVSVLN